MPVELQLEEALQLVDRQPDRRAQVRLLELGDQQAVLVAVKHRVPDKHAA